MDHIETMIAEARQAGHYALKPQPRLQLTPDVFGKLLFAQWASQMGRSDFPARDDVINVLLRHAASAPAAVRDVMQLEDRITGPTIAQYTDYAQAAQADRLIKRYNPDYVRISVEIDALTGEHLVDRFTQDLPEVRTWVEGVVRNLIEIGGRLPSDRPGQPGGPVEQPA
jgi:hypothetical protein